MWCLLIVAVLAVPLLKNFRDAGFFGAGHTTAPDIEVSKKGGPGGVVYSGNLRIPSLSADIDPQYSGRASTSYAIANQGTPESLLDYFAGFVRTEAQVIARSLDSGASIVNKNTSQAEPTSRKLGIL
jgi:hypothetical protein